MSKKFMIKCPDPDNPSQFLDLYQIELTGDNIEIRVKEFLTDKIKDGHYLSGAYAEEIIDEMFLGNCLNYKNIIEADE